MSPSATNNKRKTLEGNKTSSKKTRTEKSREVELFEEEGKDVEVLEKKCHLAEERLLRLLPSTAEDKKNIKEEDKK